MYTVCGNSMWPCSLRAPPSSHQTLLHEGSQFENQKYLAKGRRNNSLVKVCVGGTLVTRTDIKQSTVKTLFLRHERIQGPSCHRPALPPALHSAILSDNESHELIKFPSLFIFSVTLFCEFLCDRLKDHYTIIPHALFGILALVCGLC